MDKKETAQILAILRTAYPATKIGDASAMVSAWTLVLGDFSADAVMKAARLHMTTSKYFPTPAEIRKNIIRAELIYTGPPLNRIEAPKQDDSEYLDAFCRFVGLGCDPEDDADLPKGFLNYEL